MSLNTVAKLANTADMLRAEGQDENAAVLYRMAADLYDGIGMGRSAILLRRQAALCDARVNTVTV